MITRLRTRWARFAGVGRRSLRLLRVAFQNHPYRYMISCTFPLMLLERLPEEAKLEEKRKAKRSPEVVCSIRGYLPQSLMTNMLPYTDSAKIRLMKPIKNKTETKRPQKSRPIRYSLRLSSPLLTGAVVKAKKICPNGRLVYERKQPKLKMVTTSILPRRRKCTRIVTSFPYNLRFRRNVRRNSWRGSHDTAQLRECKSITITPYCLRFRRDNQHSKQVSKSPNTTRKRPRTKRNRKAERVSPRKSPRLLAQRFVLTGDENDSFDDEISPPRYRNRRCLLLSDEESGDKNDDNDAVLIAGVSFKFSAKRSKKSSNGRW
ncbi:uncharacterized protein LOC111246754 [Varroa destructor]|uniref:Uncharacterized protein n=1 Tax=Varroa destructor TaxID=109461 RepID=A0A7M7JK38_VARDE|nr:uncharacterized protein LOC111246754 [Varroa destructor]